MGSMLLVACCAAHAGAPSAATLPGESIYLRGSLASGQPVTAKREPDLTISGATAACVNCHRRSGLGEIEGSIKIPPISGPYLFRSRVTDRDHLDVPYIDGMRIDREPYTKATLARAIREGVGVDGTPLNYLMPRYTLGDADLAALVDFLKTMTPAKMPGVTGSAVNFATIVTPDADPVKRQGMLSVLDQYFADQNSFALAEGPTLRPEQKLRSNAKRRWVLHVWALTGPPATWEDQLLEHLAHEPVYAVISGLGGREWDPVHRFCEKSSLPCIFPNVELPTVAENDFYSLYFSRGVLLEAELMARQLTADRKSAAPRRVIQLFRADDVGAAAAAALHTAMAAAGIPTIERALRRTDGGTRLAPEFHGVGPRDVLILWFRPADIAALAHVPVDPSSTVLMSGLMGGLDRAPVPPEWRGITRMAYPVDLPVKRTIRVDYALGWLALHHIPVVAEQVQSDTYVACSLLMEALTHMSGSFAPDYLVERMEGMVEHQIVSGYYPRLALAPRERFASKGGYIVHFADPSGARVLPDTDWQVP